MLGESDNVSQTEYDVTAYRNVMDQLKTVDGTLDELYRMLRVQLAISLAYEAQSGRGVSSKLSGWMIQHKGLSKEKAKPKQWSRVVRKEIGAPDVLGKTDQAIHMAIARFIRKISRYQPADDYNQIRPMYGRGGGPGFHPGAWPDPQPEIKSRTYDLHNLIRNINWELNRLRIEMPFDLRQFINQLNGYATEVSQGNPYIATFKILQSVKELKKTLIPKMQKRLRDKIEQAKLTEKVAEDKIREENQRTLTTAERVEKENNDAMKKLKSKGVLARASEDAFVISFNDGESWTKITRDQLLNMAKLPKNLIRQKAKAEPSTQTQPETGSSSGGDTSSPDVDLRDWAHEYARQTEEGQKQQRETQKQNDEAMKEAAEKEGDSTGDNRAGVALAAGLALLALTGQG